MKFGLLFIIWAFASDKQKNKVESGEKCKVEEKNPESLIFVKIEEEECSKAKTVSSYAGVAYETKKSRWRAYRWNKNEKKNVYNGSYEDEETAAHASDTLARKLVANSEQNLKLNFPGDSTEVHTKKKKTSSKYIGVSYNKKYSIWVAERWSKEQSRTVRNGCYKDEETAAHASDTLARELIAKGKQNLNLNFFDGNIEVYGKTGTATSNYTGVSYDGKNKNWRAGRYSKHEQKTFHCGYYKNEEKGLMRVTLWQDN